MRLRKAAHLAASVVGLLAMGAAAPQANAATAAYSCPSNQVCMYKDANLTGTVFVAQNVPIVVEMDRTYNQFSDLNYQKYTNGERVDNSISSIVASSPSMCADTFTGTDYTGGYQRIWGGWVVNQVVYNDQITSVRMFGCRSL
ncbi:hypothetical protein SUDANB60_06275 (plasmid) [Streptomyces sp. enrichment culture]|uniref:peptidase inhibitor family I36 protein n=1 Tax=Streptomyces sp. enrichment culture TaxID=1795815 RepID=UPI003F54D5BC